LVLYIRDKVIPWHEEKDYGPESEITKNYNKYGRDVQTERGRINCMARDIPCDCMEAKRIEANKSMGKNALCFCCDEEFPKKQMLRCKGCAAIQYCSKECSIKHWREHKEWCKRNSVSSAPAPAPAPTSVPSSFEDSTDLDTGEE